MTILQMRRDLPDLVGRRVGADEDLQRKVHCFRAGEFGGYIKIVPGYFHGEYIAIRRLARNRIRAAGK